MSFLKKFCTKTFIIVILLACSATQALPRHCRSHPRTASFWSLGASAQLHVCAPELTYVPLRCAKEKNNKCNENPFLFVFCPLVAVMRLRPDVRTQETETRIGYKISKSDHLKIRCLRFLLFSKLLTRNILLLGLC